MINTVLAEVKGLVDRRFLLNGFFPSLVFAFAGGLLIASAHGGVGHWIDVWETYSGTVQAIIIAGAVAVIFLVAAFLLNNAVLIARLYEGYVSPRWLQDQARKWQLFRAQRMRYESDRDLRFPLRMRYAPLALAMCSAQLRTTPGAPTDAMPLPSGQGCLFSFPTALLPRRATRPTR